MERLSPTHCVNTTMKMAKLEASDKVTLVTGLYTWHDLIWCINILLYFTLPYFILFYFTLTYSLLYVTLLIDPCLLFYFNLNVCTFYFTLLVIFFYFTIPITLLFTLNFTYLLYFIQNGNMFPYKQNSNFFTPPPPRPTSQLWPTSSSFGFCHFDVWNQVKCNDVLILKLKFKNFKNILFVIIKT